MQSIEAVPGWDRYVCVQTPREARRHIIRTVAKSYGLTLDDILGECRDREVAWPRFACIAAVHAAFPDDSTPMLGRLFCRDHTTILHALRRAEELGIGATPRHLRR